MRARSLLAALVSALVVLSACSFSSHTPTPKATAYKNYVALGDSYSAGPLIPPADKKAPAICARSQANYPGYLARYLGVKKLSDVTCSSATSDDLYSSQSTRMGVPQNSGTKTPPQINAVKSNTDLVTIGIGANDFTLFGNIVASLAVKGGVTMNGNDIDGLETSLERAIDAIHARAPHARIVVVGYLRVAPVTGVCDDFDVTARKAQSADAAERHLNGALAKAARVKKATYIDSYAISRGHDICAGSDAWVNGPTTELFKAAPYHPFRAGMDAVAREIYRVLIRKDLTKSPTNAELGAVPRD